MAKKKTVNPSPLQTPAEVAVEKLSFDVRKNRFRNLLEENLGKKVRYSELAEIVPGNLTSHAIRHTLLKIRENLEADYHLRISVIGEHAILSQKSKSELLRRGKRATELKAHLGEILWNYLFGMKTEHDYHPPSGELEEKVRRKIEAIVEKYNVSLMIDAGTTTQAAVEALLRVDTIPFHVGIGNVENKIRDLILPSIITNSPPIVEEIRLSDHSDLVDVKLIGGNLRASRGSICGDLAQMCLRTWSLSGSLASADVAVIGSTGYRDNFNGLPAVGCDDVLEARLKGTLLSMANLKVLVFDSSKLHKPKVKSIFCQLTAETIDLVVTDDTAAREQGDDFERFSQSMKSHGVPTLVLKTEKDEKEERQS